MQFFLDGYKPVNKTAMTGLKVLNIT